MLDRLPVPERFKQRCFLLFLSLMLLLLATPFLGEAPVGRGVLGLLNALVLLTAIAAVGRSKIAVAIAAAFAVPTLLFQVLALKSGITGYFALSWGFAAFFYAFTIKHVLEYVLHRDMMTGDKLYGAVAAYILLGIFWACVIGVLQYFYPGAYAYHGTATPLGLEELIFFSFTVLTTAGFGDITPLIIHSRFFTILEALSGVMYVAILVARLTGIYSPESDKTSRAPQ
jgi:Ion channel